eukprot:6189709-Pleurochrysis_carterae.AAC.2
MKRLSSTLSLHLRQSCTILASDSKTAPQSTHIRICSSYPGDLFSSMRYIPGADNCVGVRRGNLQLLGHGVPAEVQSSSSTARRNMAFDVCGACETQKAKKARAQADIYSPTIKNYRDHERELAQGLVRLSEHGAHGLSLVLLAQRLKREDSAAPAARAHRGVGVGVVGGAQHNAAVWR